MQKKANRKWKVRLHEIMYEADTPGGKIFDIILIILIVASIILVMLESIKSFDDKYHDILLACEWVVTIFFTFEYIGRIISLRRPIRYIFSFYGIVDFLSTIPLYISYFLAGSQVLLAIRAFRLLRIFRILKLVRFLGEASQLRRALRASRAKITVFVYTVLILAVILGTIMYLVEGDESGFNSIPRSIYWTIVTLTTVGYGDITPQTALGQSIATLIMILGYGIIAVPTGIVSAELVRNKVDTNTQSCPNCGTEGHKDGAIHCYKCGTILNED